MNTKIPQIRKAVGIPTAIPIFAPFDSPLDDILCVPMEDADCIEEEVGVGVDDFAREDVVGFGVDGVDDCEGDVVDCEGGFGAEMKLLRSLLCHQTGMPSPEIVMSDVRVKVLGSLFGAKF